MLRKLFPLLFFIFFVPTSEAGHVSLPLRLFIERGAVGVQDKLLSFDENQRIELLVDTKNPEDIRKWLRANGGTSGTFAGGILTVRVPANLLPHLVKIPSVEGIAPSRKLRPLLNVSRQMVYADKAESGAGLPRSINGTDTIVGIVDTGIDYTHPDFKNPDGTTRIIALWDQTIPGTPPPDFGYGAECDVNSINNGTCREIDADPDYSHGSHVAGIAGGSHTTYRGIAPSAMLVVVKTGYTEGTVIDGVDYVFRIAEKYKKPAVVNLSLGGNYGPHDGKGELVRALEALQGPGRVIVSAGGNSGHMRIHAGGVVTSEEWYVIDYFSGETTGGLDIWYDAPDALDFAIAGLRQSNALCAQTSFVPPGQSGEFSLSCSGLNCGSVYIDATTISYPGNGSRNVLVIIESPSTSQDLSTCRWALVVKPSPTDPSGGNFDAWITTDNGEFTESPVLLTGLGSLFSVPGDTDKTISIPSDGNYIIGVGSYTSKTRWSAKDGNDYTCESSNPPCIQKNISYFSSKGPTRDGRIKPDITAPGEWIASARSSDAIEIDARLLLPDNLHFVLAGTSMASPHVTGAVALLFDMNSQLTPDEVIKLIRDNADTDSFTGSVPNNIWGYGKLNIERALENLSPAETDKKPPLISDIVIEMEEDKINLFWRTDELADSAVKISNDENGESLFTRMSYSQEHNFTITGIDTDKVFRIDVISSDPRGNSSTVTNLPGILPNEGCGCSYAEGRGGPLSLLIYLFLLAPVFLRGLRRVLNICNCQQRRSRDYTQISR